MLKAFSSFDGSFRIKGIQLIFNNWLSNKPRTEVAGERVPFPAGRFDAIYYLILKRLAFFLHNDKQVLPGFKKQIFGKPCDIYLFQESDRR